MFYPKYAVVDIETTGQSKSNDRIIQIAIVIIEDGEITEQFSSFLNPEMDIPGFIQELTKISNEYVKHAPTFKHIAEDIYDYLSDAVFVAHNVEFDFSFLQAELKRAGLPKLYCKKIDTLELCKILFPTSDSYQLGDLSKDLKIELAKAHRADDDAKATAELLLKCWEQLLAIPLKTLEQIHKYSFQLKSNISQLVFEAIQLKREKIENSTNYIYYRQIAIKKQEHKTNRPIQEKRYPQTSADKLALLKQSMPNAENRPAQFAMMDQIWHSFEQGTEIAIEASTGIGKSLAYLLPSIYYSDTVNKPIVISTYTSHLMDQLIQEEIPKLERMLGERVNAVLLKGMAHYIDLKLFADQLATTTDSYDEIIVRLQLLVWLTATETGDLNELNVTGGGMLFIDKIRKTYGNTKTNNDFFERAIKEANTAQVIITNHSMLLADFERKEKIFQDISAIIIDEAHQFPNAAIQKESRIFSYSRWKYLFGQVGLLESNGRLAELARLFKSTGLFSMQQFILIEKQFIQMEAQFNLLMKILQNQLELVTSTTQEVKRAELWQNLTLPTNQFTMYGETVNQFIGLVESVLNKINEQQLLDLTAENKLTLQTWTYIIHQFKVCLVEWDTITYRENLNQACWVEFDLRSLPSSIQIHTRPIEIDKSSLQVLDVIRQKSPIIWTSGTLTVPENERFILQQLQFTKEIPIYRYEAPTDYFSGASAYIVSDMPDIQAVSQVAYIEKVAEAIAKIAKAMKGRMFVLFTSQQMLKETATLIAAREDLQEYMLFAQGVTSGSRMKLVKSFRKFPKSILFGTNSFWEGVDVPGDELAAVVVVRLPFTAPEDPIFKAKSMEMQREGINAFQHLSLPEAIIRFKQGFGRLVRSSHDRGAFIILDRRIERKSYGKQFIDALPKIEVKNLPLDDMVIQLEHWYNNGE